MKLLFVCLGNICRSPLAETLFADYARSQGRPVVVDSAGTASAHQGERADPRSRACAERHGLTITHRARGVVDEDFDKFDFLIAMDESNAEALRRRAPDAAARKKVHLLREWDPAGPGDIPDPYYGDESDFEHVWHLCERSIPGLWRTIVDKERK